LCFSVRLAARPKSGVARYSKSSWTYSPLRFLRAGRLGFQPFAQSGFGDVIRHDFGHSTLLST